MTVSTEEETDHPNEMEYTEKGEESKGVWSCMHRMYNCLLALPVLCLLGVVLLLGGHFEGDTTRFRQTLADLRSSSNLLNVTRQISEETILSHVFWLHQSEDARAELEQHVTLTNELLLSPSQWLPATCVARLQLHKHFAGLYQRFLNARAGTEFNEPPSELEREEFHHFVLNIAVCPMTDTSTDLLRNEIQLELAYYHLLAASILMQHLTTWHKYECRYAHENISSTPIFNLAKAEAYSILAEFVSSGKLFWFNSSLLKPLISCSDEYLVYLQNKLEFIIMQTMQTQELFLRHIEKLLRETYVDLLVKSSLITATVVGLLVAIYIFSNASLRSREMAREVTLISRFLRTQTEKKEKALDLCIPRIIAHNKPSSPKTLGYTPDTDNFKVSATVLAFEIPGLGHVMQEGDCSAALWAMTHILSLVEEKVCKHQAFVLRQQAAASIVAAVSDDVHCSNWPLCCVADLALDLMTSLADVELTLTSDGHLRPRFGIHTGQAIGYMGAGRPVRYCVVGDLVTSAVHCQKRSAPHCIRLTWVTYCALARLGHYICLESDACSVEDCANTPPDNGPALYLKGKRTSHDEGLLHPVTTKQTITTAHWVFHYV